jgi:hypothetical protein
LVNFFFPAIKVKELHRSLRYTHLSESPDKRLYTSPGLKIKAFPIFFQPSAGIFYNDFLMEQAGSLLINNLTQRGFRDLSWSLQCHAQPSWGIDKGYS